MDSWDSIVAWLVENAPAEQARPPATAEHLMEAERQLGIGLPADLLDWWRQADGMAEPGRLLRRYRPYSVLEALNSRDVWMSAWNEVMAEMAVTMDPPVDFTAWVAQENRAPAGSSCTSAWLPLWLPIAGDGGGNDLFLDLRPGPAHGCVREFRRDAGASDETLWSGVADMLADIAATLPRGDDDSHSAPIDKYTRNQMMRERARQEQRKV